MLNKSGVSISLGDHLPISFFIYSLFSLTAVLPPVCTLLPVCFLFDLGSLSVVYLEFARLDTSNNWLAKAPRAVGKAMAAPGLLFVFDPGKGQL